MGTVYRQTVKTWLGHWLNLGEVGPQCTPADSSASGSKGTSLGRSR